MHDDGSVVMFVVLVVLPLGLVLWAAAILLSANLFLSIPGVCS